MNKQDEQQQAADALATVQAHQDRARQAAQVPWWAYAAMFVLTAGGIAINDYLNLTGAKLMAGIVVILLVVVLVTSFATGSAPLSRVRGVQPRQSLVPSAFIVVAVVACIGVWLISSYGNSFAHSLAGAVGLPHYPNTVVGVVYGAAFTALFALSQFLITTAQQRKGR